MAAGSSVLEPAPDPARRVEVEGPDHRVFGAIPQFAHHHPPGQRHLTEHTGTREMTGCVVVLRATSA